MLSRSPVPFEIYIADRPSLTPCIPPPTLSFETLSRPLHIPSPLLTFTLSDTKNAYSGIPTTFYAIAVNRRPQQITEIVISGTIDSDKGTKRFCSPIQPSLEPSRALTFPILPFLQETAGSVTVSAVIEYKFENNKFKGKAKEIYNFEAPLNVILRVHRGTVMGYELRVENSKLGQPLLNVRAQVDTSEVPIARMLGMGEAAAGIAMLSGPPQSVQVLWDLPGCPACSQIVPPAAENENQRPPVAIAVGNLQPIVACLAPFKAKIIVENRAKIPLSGELTIRNGAIALSGLNSLQFTELAPGKSETLEGSFVALEEGRVPFPLFQVAIKEGPQFEVDAANGVFVVGSAV